MSDNYPLPPVTHTHEGAERRIGVEIEYSGLALDKASALLAQHFCGEVQVLNLYEHQISTALGDFKIEFDMTYLKQMGRDNAQAGRASHEPAHFGEWLLKNIGETLMPYEIVTPPLPMSQLAQLEALVTQLRAAGAKGTKASLFSAYGMHFNPELPDTQTATVLAYLQAFLCLYDWIKAREQVDISRRMTTFIDPFPKAYVLRVIDKNYQPDSAHLIDDYLDFNPTRNRALDMLPVLTFMDETRVKTQLNDPRIGKRPALHYRLPNSSIAQPQWRILDAWEDWLEVEKLAHDSTRLADYCQHYHYFLREAHPLDGLFDDWAEQVSVWLNKSLPA